MATFVRSFDPIWYNVDLQALPFDDTFYLWTLQNTIPYLPQAVWHDPQGQVPWTDPIQFLSNGTLPVDIYWDPSLVYRLEFRHNINGLPPSQNDALIYEVNNYTPGAGGNTPPINSAGSITDNQITNPQFALYDLNSPLTLTSVLMTPSTPLHIGPGWDLLLNGTGNATIQQTPLNANAGLISPTNAPYALQMTLSGWTDPPILRQRFDQNGINWSGLNVSTSITAQAGTPGVQISARIVDSQGNTTLLPLTASGVLSTSFNEYKGFGLVPAATNTNTPPAAFIDYEIILPQNVLLLLTSIQVIASGSNVAVPFSYEQITVNREIDHSYNRAYPIVPVGTVIDFGGFRTPAHYLRCFGQLISRRDFNLLFQATTNLETVTLNGTNIINVADGNLYVVGRAIEGPGIPPSTTIVTIVVNQITMSNSASTSGPSLLRFFAGGAGDGSTTFQVYDLTGTLIAGDGDAFFSTGTNGLAQTGVLTSGTGVVTNTVVLLTKCIRFE